MITVWHCLRKSYPLPTLQTDGDFEPHCASVAHESISRNRNLLVQSLFRGMIVPCSRNKTLPRVWTILTSLGWKLYLGKVPGWKEIISASTSTIFIGIYRNVKK